jgi:hypothetical protein
MTTTPTRITRGPYAELDAEGQAAVLRQCWQRMKINGEDTVTHGDLTTVCTASGSTEITNANDPYVSVNQCEHCHRSDLRKKIAYSLDEAIAFGWIVPVQ